MHPSAFAAETQSVIPTKHESRKAPVGVRGHPLPNRAVKAFIQAKTAFHSMPRSMTVSFQWRAWHQNTASHPEHYEVSMHFLNPFPHRVLHTMWLFIFSLIPANLSFACRLYFELHHTVTGSITEKITAC